MNDIATTRSALALTTDETIAVLESSLYPGAKRESIMLVIDYCRASGLDPLQKPVHIVPMSVKIAGEKDKYEWRDVIMPGINLYRVQAAETGQFVGMTEPQFGPLLNLRVGADQIFKPNGVAFEYPEWCKVTVYRQIGGQVAAFTAVEFWDENYATQSKDSVLPNKMWQKRPRGQLAKCAEAQALRKAFPERTGAPTADELEGKVLNADAADPNTIEGSVVDKTPQSKSAKAVKGDPEKKKEPDAGDLLGERKWVENKIKEKGLDQAEVLKVVGLEHMADLTVEKFQELKTYLTKAE
jgi:phage recombination protein Bet